MSGLVSTSVGVGPTIRSVGPGDDAAIEDIFDDTILLGSALTRQPVAFEHYRQLSLGWYLGPGRGDAAVAVDPTGSVVGYVLVCVDEAAATRFAAQRVVALTRRVVSAGMCGRLDAQSRSFYAARARDASALLAARRTPPAPAHVHLNVGSAARTFTVARALVGHVDARCRSAGHGSWYGEVNERVGTRRGALEWLGAEVVESAPNRTFTALLGEPVRRLTFVRRLGGPST